MLGFGGIAKRLFGSSNDRYVKSLAPLVARVNALEGQIEALSDAELTAQTAKLQALHAEGASLDDLLPEVAVELKRSGLWKEEWASGPGHEWFTRTVDLLRPRVRLLPDFSSWSWCRHSRKSLASWR